MKLLTVRGLSPICRLAYLSFVHIAVVYNSYGHLWIFLSSFTLCLVALGKNKISLDSKSGVTSK